MSTGLCTGRGWESADLHSAACDFAQIRAARPGPLRDGLYWNRFRDQAAGRPQESRKAERPGSYRRRGEPVG